MGFPKRAIRFIKAKAKANALYREVPKAYLEAAKQPVDEKKVIFLEATREQMSNSFEVMYKVMRDDYGMNVEFESQGVYRLGPAELYRNYKRLARKIATARFVVVSEASELVGCLPLRDETDVIQVWHACGAFKKFGMSTAEKTFGGNRASKLRHPQYSNASVVTVSSPEVKWAYVEALSLEATPDIVQPLGTSRTDVFFDGEYLAAAREEALRIVPAIAGKKVIAYAPTFRGRVASATGPDELDWHLMKERLGGEYVVLVKHHPHVKELPPIPDDCADFAFQVTRDMSIETLMVVADICISDYSSLVFEYSLFERPMIFFAYDLDDYDDWRGFYYDYDEMTPGPILTDTASIVDYIEHIDERFDKAEVVAFKDKFMRSCDGHATRRICDLAFDRALPAILSGQAREAARIAFESRPPEETLGDFARSEAKRVRRRAVQLAKRAVEWETLNVKLPLRYLKAAHEKPVKDGKVLLVERCRESEPRDFAYLEPYLARRFSNAVKKISYSTQGSFRLRMDRYAEIARELVTSEFVVLNGHVPLVERVALRRGTKVAQLWHCNDAVLPWEMKGLKGAFRNESLVATCGEAVGAIYSRAMGLDASRVRFEPVGMSRTDAYFDEAFLYDRGRSLEASFPACEGKKVILYAPAPRFEGSKATSPHWLDIHLMKRELGDDYVLVIRQHEEVKGTFAIPDDCADFAFEPTGYMPDDELLLAADIGIFDYTPSLFEFALLDRPMFLLAPDRGEVASRGGFAFDYDAEMPWPIVDTTAELIEALRAQGDDAPAGDVVEPFIRRYMGACDGNATQRFCDALFGSMAETYRKDVVADAYAKANPNGKDLSIIVPAYNAMPELTRALESATRQSYPAGRYEVIVVDDGSTDGTWNEIRRFDQEFPETVKGIRLDEPSGSPAAPRNAALERATGEYVFFLDADDWLGCQAVERMLEHAAEWNSDVLVARMVGAGGRKIPQTLFRGNQPSVSVGSSNVASMIGPTKLFRRSLLDDHGLRFLEGGMPEDLHVVIPALRFADVISIAADYPYYYCSYREDVESNTSKGLWGDIDRNMRSYELLMQFISSEFTPEERNHQLMRRLMRRDVNQMLRTVGRCEPGERRQRWHKQVVSLFGPYYVPEVYESMLLNRRLVLEAGFNKGLDVLAEVVPFIERPECIDDLSFGFADGGIECRLPSDAGGFACTVTGGVRIGCRIDRLALDAEAPLKARLSGNIEMSELLRRLGCDLELNLVARRLGDSHEVWWPCGLRFAGKTSGEAADVKAHGTWNADIDLGKLPIPEQPEGSAVPDGQTDAPKVPEGRLAKWNFRLHLKVGDYSRYTRVMVNRYSAELKGAFKQSLAVSDAARGRFGCQEMGNKIGHLTYTVKRK